MTAHELFEQLADRIPAGIMREFPGYQGCVLATRIAIEVGAYFGIEVAPASCKLVLYNDAYRRHIDRGEEPDARKWAQEDGAHAVGVGFAEATTDPTKWKGHLIALADGWFGDFSIGQAERIDRGIITGPALVGPARGRRWQASNEHGTCVEYSLTADVSYRGAPDWKDARRRRRISGPIIRELRSIL